MKVADRIIKESRHRKERLDTSFREHRDHTNNSHPRVSLSFVDITGRTKLSAGISETRENKKIAASKDWKNKRAPAKKKFPILQMS